MDPELITLAEAAGIMGIETLHWDEQKERWMIHPTRRQNRLWELLPQLREQGFPARKLGKSWMVHKPSLGPWLLKHWSNAA
jgi:hypothetical protein